MGDLPGVMVAAFAVAIFASGGFVVALYYRDKVEHAQDDELHDAFEHGRTFGWDECETFYAPRHVRCVPRPFDHAEDGL